LFGDEPGCRVVQRNEVGTRAVSWFRGEEDQMTTIREPAPSILPPGAAFGDDLALEQNPFLAGSGGNRQELHSRALEPDYERMKSIRRERGGEAIAESDRRSAVCSPEICGQIEAAPLSRLGKEDGQVAL
jgi:hypothetical protein